METREIKLGEDIAEGNCKDKSIKLYGHIKDDAVIVTRVDEVCNNCQEVYGAIENDCGLCEEWI